MIESVVISSGHGKLIRGAKGYLDEVDEARRVTNRVAEMLRAAELEVKVYHDDASRTQSENLRKIVAFHNGQKNRDLDVSVHFNDSGGGKIERPIGTEVLYLTQAKLAAEVARQISIAGGLKDRGAKKRTNLAFLKTNKPAILIEVAFVNSQADTTAYRAHFEKICAGIAKAIVEHK